MFPQLLVGGLTLGKMLMDKNAADKQRKANAEAIRYSPWTGMSPTEVKDDTLLGTALGGASTVMALNQGAAKDPTDTAEKAMDAGKGALPTAYSAPDSALQAMNGAPGAGSMAPSLGDASGGVWSQMAEEDKKRKLMQQYGMM